MKKREELQLVTDVLWPVKALTPILRLSLTSLTDYFFLLFQLGSVRVINPVSDSRGIKVTVWTARTTN